MKVGRNEPCPCGSNKKFKRCCIDKQTAKRVILAPPRTIPREVAAMFTAAMAEQKRRSTEFGDVRDIIHADYQGYKFVAVGGRLHYSKEWKTFPDFLNAYIKTTLGSDGWGDNEIAKPLHRRHVLMQWYDHLCRQQKAQVDAGLEREAAGTLAGTWGFAVDGPSKAFVMVAYDLYVLDHSSKLQAELVRRLKLWDQFFGARYELFVAATFVRGGFDLAFEDETDGSTKHPEFVATHKLTGFKAAVEAKARNRSVAPGASIPDKAGVQGLISSAAKKATNLPYILCVEVNMPPDSVTGPPSWGSEVDATLKDVVQRECGGRSPFDLVVFSNTAHHYGEAGGEDPAKHFYVWNPPDRRATDVPAAIQEALVKAIATYGNVPQQFPDDERFKRIGSSPT